MRRSPSSAPCRRHSGARSIGGFRAPGRQGSIATAWRRCSPSHSRTRSHERRAPMDAVVETTAVTKRYGSVIALSDCDVALPRGKVSGLVGPNGAGKTTLLHLAVGLLRPSAGTVRVFGHDSTRETSAILPRIGFVAQDRPLYPDLTVADSTELARRLSETWDAAYVLARVTRFGLPMSRKIRTLSTGQRAQVALSLALGKRPELLLLDEPVANLDPVARLALLEELMSVVADDGLTVVFSA